MGESIENNNNNASHIELSQKQKDLLSLLMQLNMNTEDIVMTMSCCQEESQIIQMINHILDLMDNNEEITMQKVLNKIVEMNQ